MILNGVVLWIHIFGAIGWLGSVMLFGMVIGPALPRLSAPSRGEFVVTVFPKFTRYVEAFSISTLVFGVAMVAVLTGGDFSGVSLSTPLWLYVSIGAGLALVSLVLALAVIIPTTHKIVKISKTLAKTPGPPPAELISAFGKVKVTSTVVMVLLILVTIFMVAGATA